MTATDPVFREPWEAQAFALAVTLLEQGTLTRAEWAQALGEQLATGQGEGSDDTYYLHWARALERVVTAKGAITSSELDERTERWRRAFLATPHGRPVDLSGAE